MTCQAARHGQLVFLVPQPRHCDIMVYVDTVDRKVKTLVSTDTAMCVDTVDRMVKPWSHQTQPRVWTGWLSFGLESLFSNKSGGMSLLLECSLIMCPSKPASLLCLLLQTLGL